MSIWPDQPNDFVRWLSVFLGREIATDEFVARSDYGRYLEAALSPSLDSGRLDWYQDECVSLQPQDGVLRLELKQRGTLLADRVVLATGHQKARAIPGIHDPFHAPLPELRADERVLQSIS
jgi:uncharacterized NAD(P)/FAD-binding protein YdhS